MREMKNSGIEWIGTIPNHWSLAKIGGLYSLRNEKVSDKDYPPLSVTNKGILPQLETAAKTNDGDNRKLVKVGDFAINSRSDRRGSCGISPYDGSVSLINIVMTPRKEMVPTYFEWLFHTVQFGDENYRWGHGIVDDLWTTGWQEMKKITIPFPPLAEQKSIATYLDAKCAEIDALTADIQTQIDTLEQYKRSVVTEAVTKGLNPDAEMKDSGVQWIGEIPSHWIISKFKYIACIKSNLVLPDNYKEYPQISPDNIEKYSGRLISYNSVEESGIISGNHLFYKGQILYSKIRPNLNKVIIAPFNGLCSADMYPIEAHINKCFTLYLMLSNYFVDQVSVVIHDRVKMPKINQEELAQIHVVVPPAEEQTQIADYLDAKVSEIDSIIDQKKEQLETLESYKKSLIYEYVTGKKEVPVAESDVISVILDPHIAMLGMAIDKLGKDIKGKIQLQKILYLLDEHLGFNHSTQYYRYAHGPYDLQLNNYIGTLTNNHWYKHQYNGADILVKGTNHNNFIAEHGNVFAERNAEVDKLINFLKPMKTRQVERIATLFAAWNDFIIDGNVHPTDDQIINEVMTNWTDNKANMQYTTWQSTLAKMKQHGIIPKGKGLHTLPMPQKENDNE